MIYKANINIFHTLKMQLCICFTGLAAPAAFTNGAYLINAQEPYLIPGNVLLMNLFFVV